MMAYIICLDKNRDVQNCANVIYNIERLVSKSSKNWTNLTITLTVKRSNVRDCITLICGSVTGVIVKRVTNDLNSEFNFSKNLLC